MKALLKMYLLFLTLSKVLFPFIAVASSDHCVDNSLNSSMTANLI